MWHHLLAQMLLGVSSPEQPYLCSHWCCCRLQLCTSCLQGRPQRDLHADQHADTACAEYCEANQAALTYFQLL